MSLIVSFVYIAAGDRGKPSACGNCLDRFEKERLLNLRHQTEKEALQQKIDDAERRYAECFDAYQKEVSPINQKMQSLQQTIHELEPRLRQVEKEKNENFRTLLREREASESLKKENKEYRERFETGKQELQRVQKQSDELLSNLSCYFESQTDRGREFCLNSLSSYPLLVKSIREHRQREQESQTQLQSANYSLQKQKGELEKSVNQQEEDIRKLQQENTELKKQAEQHIISSRLLKNDNPSEEQTRLFEELKAANTQLKSEFEIKQERIQKLEEQIKILQKSSNEKKQASVIQETNESRNTTGKFVVFGGICSLLYLFYYLKK